jgi:hypothetical protein
VTTQPVTVQTSVEFTPALLVASLVGLAIAIFVIVAYWKLYTKAGKPGWAAIVPFYNLYVLLKIVGRPGWWLIWYFIPIANIVVLIIVMIDLAKAFNKSGWFALVLILFPYIGVPILAFGEARYVGPIADPNYPTYGPGGSTEPGYPGQQPHFRQPQPGQQYPPQQPGQQYPPQH